MMQVQPPEPGPRNAWLIAIAVYAAATLLLAYPVLSGGFLVTPQSDQYLGGFPVREFAAAMLRDHHQFPLWNPYIFGGMPYVAAMHGDIFYPTFLLRMILPTDVAMSWAFIIHVYLCGVFAFGFLRACGMSFFGALIGGLAYMLSGNIAGLVSPGHDGKLYLGALTPLALWLLVLGMRQGKSWVWGVLGIVAGLAVLSPHPQVLQYMLLVCGAWALFLAFGPWPLGVPLSRPVAIRRLIYAFGALALGFAIGAIQYVPVMEYVAWSPRAAGLPGYEVATSFSMPPEEFINAYLPQFSGILSAYWGRNGIHHHSDYIGAAVLLLAVAGLGGRGPRAGKKFVWFWVGVLIVAALWAMGGFTPFYRLVYAIVPGTKFFRAPSAMLYVVSLCVAIFAAVGVDRLTERDFSLRYVWIWSGIALLVAVLASAGFFTGLGQAFVDEFRQPALAANAQAVTLGAWRSCAFVLLAGAILYGLHAGKMPPRLAAWLLALVVTADLWSIERLYWRVSPPAKVLYASDPTIDYIKKQPQPGRVLPLVTGSSQVAYHDPFLQGDALMVHEIRNALGYHGNHIARYGRLGADDERLMLTPRFWQLANVKYLLTNEASLEKQLRKVVGPVKNAAGSTVYLYELPGDNPAAWVTPVIVKAGDDQVLGTLYHERFDPRAAALFDSAASVKPRTDLQQAPKPIDLPVTVKAYEPGHIELELAQPAPEGAALIVSENFYPGWTATADGKPAVAARADLSLIGVELPAGARQVVLQYASRTYERGKLITLVALAISVLLAAGGLVFARRSPAPAGLEGTVG